MYKMSDAGTVLSSVLTPRQLAIEQWIACVSSNAPCSLYTMSTPPTVIASDDDEERVVGKSLLLKLEFVSKH